MASLGERLKELRIEKNLTQEQLANICGVARSTISVYEINQSQPDDNIKKILASFFDVSIDYLCGYTDIEKTGNLYYSPNDLSLVKIPLFDSSNSMNELFSEKNIKKHIFVNKKKAENGSYFFINVPDDYMINARIAPGDLIYVCKQSIPCDGNIIVIIDDKTNLTLRRAVKAENSLLLISENPYKYSTFNTSDIRSGIIKIIGKVVSVIFQV